MYEYWLGYLALNIWLGRSKSWYFSTNEISHNGHFFILNNFLEFMTFIFKRDYFIFAFDCLYSFIAAGHLKGKELGQLFRGRFQPRCFIQCQQMCNQNHPPLSLNKEGKHSFWKWKKIETIWMLDFIQLFFKWCTSCFCPLDLSLRGWLLIFKVTWNKVVRTIFEPFCGLSALHWLPLWTPSLRRPLYHPAMKSEFGDRICDFVLIKEVLLKSSFEMEVVFHSIDFNLSDFFEMIPKGGNVCIYC